MNFQPRLRGLYPPSQLMRGRSQMRTPFRGSFHGKAFSNQIENQSEEFWCETCDRGFRSSIMLQNHKKEHMKCAIDGCQFVAHPKIITKHIEMQHSTGLFNRIGNLDKPEDIQKWREERKKRYPTKENMDKKKAELEAKVKRGEKMGLPNNDRKKKYDTGSNSRRKDNYKKKHTQNLHVKRKSLDPNNVINQKVEKHELETNIASNDRKLRPFQGIQSLVESDVDHNELPDIDIPIEEDEFESETSNTAQQSQEKKVTVCSALSSLMMSYDFSDEDDNDNNEQIDNNKLRKLNQIDKSATHLDSIKNNDTLMTGISEKCVPEKESSNNLFRGMINELTVLIPQNNETTNNIKSEIKSGITFEKNEFSLNDSKGEDSGPEEVHCKLSENMNTVDVNVNKQIRSTKRTAKILPLQKRKERKKTKLPSTLLEKLLSNEIRHERNVVLQCVRYIVKNNYFEKL